MNNNSDPYSHHIVIVVNNGNPKQLQGFQILLLKYEVDLTRRELESIDFVYRSTGRIQDIAFAMLGTPRLASISSCSVSLVKT